MVDEELDDKPGSPHICQIKFDDPSGQMDYCFSYFELEFNGKLKTKIFKILNPFDQKFPYFKCHKNNAAVISASVIGGACGITIIGESLS